MIMLLTDQVKALKIIEEYSNWNTQYALDETLLDNKEFIIEALKLRHSSFLEKALTELRLEHFGYEQYFVGAIIEYRFAKDKGKAMPVLITLLLHQNKLEEAREILSKADLKFVEDPIELPNKRMSEKLSMLNKGNGIGSYGLRIVFNEVTVLDSADDALKKIADCLQGKSHFGKKIRPPVLSTTEMLNRMALYPSLYQNMNALALENHASKKLQSVNVSSKDSDINDSVEQSLTFVNENTFTRGEYVNRIENGTGGYYDSGTIKFRSTEQDSGHYGTFTSCGYGLAISLSVQAFELWQKMLQTGKITETEVFKIVECGAGEGFLCQDMLNYIYERAVIDKEWKIFLSVVEYHIIEKSTTLRDRQTKKMQILEEKTGIKVKVHKGDALNLEDSDFAKTEKNGCALFFSNELLDMFPPEKIRFCTESDKIQVALSLLGIHEDDLQNFGLSEKEIGKIEQQADIYRIHLDRCNKILPKNKEEKRSVLFLPKKIFSRLFDIYSGKDYKGKQDVFCGQDIYVDLNQDHAELYNYLEKNYNNGISSLKKGEFTIIMPGIDRFFLGVEKICHGKVISIDYGFTELQKAVDEDIRTYPMVRTIYQEIGKVDITADVNFKHVPGKTVPQSWLYNPEKIKETENFKKTEKGLWGKATGCDKKFFFSAWNLFEEEKDQGSVKQIIKVK